MCLIYVPYFPLIVLALHLASTPNLHHSPSNDLVQSLLEFHNLQETLEPKILLEFREEEVRCICRYALEPQYPLPIVPCEAILEFPQSLLG